MGADVSRVGSAALGALAGLAGTIAVQGLLSANQRVAPETLPPRALERDLRAHDDTPLGGGCRADEASFKNGVLEVRIPKAQEAKGWKIEIKAAA